MSTEQADQYASYLLPEIEQAQKIQRDTQKAIQYKQAGLDFIGACKFASTDDSGVIDVVILKQKLTEAINFVQNYHDNL